MRNLLLIAVLLGTACSAQVDSNAANQANVRRTQLPPLRPLQAVVDRRQDRPPRLPSRLAGRSERDSRAGRGDPRPGDGAQGRATEERRGATRPSGQATASPSTPMNIRTSTRSPGQRRACSACRRMVRVHRRRPSDARHQRPALGRRRARRSNSPTCSPAASPARRSIRQGLLQRARCRAGEEARGKPKGDARRSLQRLPQVRRARDHPQGRRQGRDSWATSGSTPIPMSRAPMPRAIMTSSCRSPRP